MKLSKINQKLKQKFDEMTDRIRLHKRAIDSLQWDSYTIERLLYGNPVSLEEKESVLTKYAISSKEQFDFSHSTLKASIFEILSAYPEKTFRLKELTEIIAYHGYKFNCKCPEASVASIVRKMKSGVFYQNYKGIKLEQTKE